MKRAGYVYMLKCADGSYYVGSYQSGELETRISEHQQGKHPGAYTFRRRPVELVWHEEFAHFDDMAACERQLKGWSRAKKEALIRGDETTLKRLASRSLANRRPS